MSSAACPARAGDIVSLTKPPQYWRRRAEYHRKRGEHHREAALLRHAVALDPASEALRLEYAQALQAIRCFDASNREAFSVLTQKPDSPAPYAIIAWNMLSLGHQQEAMDAFAHYFQQGEGGYAALAPAFGQNGQLWQLETLAHNSPTKRCARLNALFHIVSARMLRSDTEGAWKALNRATELSPKDPRVDVLSAVLFETQNELNQVLAHAKRAAASRPAHVSSLCLLASAQFHLNHKGLACAALLKAAFCCRFPQDELIFCLTAASLGMTALSVAMLKLVRQRYPERLPTLYNSAVALLSEDNVEEAQLYLHRCLDLDPTDLAVRALYDAMQKWQQGASREIPAFYPLLSGEAAMRLLTDFQRTIEKGLGALLNRLMEEPIFYRGFLYGLALPGSPLGSLPVRIASALRDVDTVFAERMLRDVLVQDGASSQAKRQALTALAAGGAEPPYVLWEGGRILCLMPPAQPVPSVLQSQLTRRMQRLVRSAGDSRVIPHALAILKRSRPLRYSLALDKDNVWSLALLEHFARSYGIRGRRWLPISQRTSVSARIARALEALCAVMPPKQ